MKTTYFFILVLLAFALNADVSNFQIGANYTYLKLDVDEGPSYNANLGGLQSSYEYKPCNSVYEALLLNWRQGTTNHEWPTRSIVYVNAEERLGYTYNNETLSLTLFTGVGYNYIGHKLQSTGIHLNYNEFYVPIGFLSEYAFCSNWGLGLNGSWMPQVFPIVAITPLQGAYWALKYRLTNFLLELPITYYVGCERIYSFILKPFYQYWQDGQSSAKNALGDALGLPANTYNFVGVELRFNVTF